ncbi:tetratricopeptide repeat protein [Actinoplanes sp. CA-051413]|uniref:tetratricopeptide repeat protein n=1 Tax=Actinoplanes sp. CA-051413 TaxID=3239899 RepID=UPI003D988DE4
MSSLAVSVALPLAEHDVTRPLRGRQAVVEELAEIVGQTRAPARTRVLHGLGGSGKTLIALHVAREVAARGVPVWWVSAAEPSAFVTAMHAVAQLLGATEAELQEQDPADILWRRLEVRTEPWLLVVDNADDVSLLDSGSADLGGARALADGRAWIRPLASGPGLVIVTSRDGDPKRWGRWCALTPIGKLTAADGAQVLLDHTRNRCGSREEAETLAKRLGGLPLALSLAGSYLADNITDPWPDADSPTTFTAYRDALEAGRSDLLTPEPDDDDERQARRLIDGIWRLSVDLLEQRGATGARLLMRLLSHFAEAPVPYRLMLQPSVLKTSSIFVGIDREKLRSILVGASHLGLIDLSTLATPNAAAHGEIPLLSLHPLMRDASRHAEDVGGDYLSLAARLLCAAVQDEEETSPQDPKQWPKWQLMAPHAVLLLKDLVDQEKIDAVLVASVARVADLTIRQTHVRGLYLLAHTQYRALQEACTTALGPDHPSVLSSRHGAALALWSLGGVLAAQTEFREILDIRQQILGEEHPDTLIARHNLAGALRERGDYVAAQAEFEAVLAIQRRVLGEEHPNTLTTRQNLAGVLRERGDYVAAQAEFEAVLAIQRRVLSEEHPDALTTRQNLAGVLGERGDYVAAQAEFEAVLATRRRVLGEEHPNTLITRHGFAGVLQARGDYVAAQAEFEAVFAIERRVLGDEHPNTLTTRHGLAGVLQARGDYVAAQAEFEAVFAIERRMLGDEHPDALTTRHNLAGALRARGDYVAAQAEFEAVLGTRRRVLGDEHPNTLTTRHNLAGVLQARGDYVAAQAEFEAVFAIERRVLGDEHPNTLTTRHNLAGILQAAGDYGAAQAEFEAVLAIERRVLGEEHPYTLITRHSLAGALAKHGDHPAAMAEYQATLSVMERVLGPRHPTTLAARKNFEVARQTMASRRGPVLWHGPGKRRKGKKK